MSQVTRILYFDTAATTPVAPEVMARMVETLSGADGDANPASAHRPGQAAAAVVATARAAIAAELGCEPDEVIFTSGATEANNLALRGVALAHVAHGRHLVTSAIEHPAVLACCDALQRAGYVVTRLAPNRQGWIEPDAVRAALRPDTLLVSLMHTNNETGVMQPIAEVAAIAAEAGVLFHVDAAQAAGKFAIDLHRLPIDLLALSAHKFHGPKGVGCLVVRDRRRLRLQPLLYGGRQEFALRPGTLATHQIVGLSAALTLAARRRATDLAHVAALKRRFLERLSARLTVQVHGDPERCSPYIVNLAIPGVGSDALLNQVAADVALASGAACASGTVEPSPVLRAMGIEGEPLYGAVRVSFSRDHTASDVDRAVGRIDAACVGESGARVTIPAGMKPLTITAKGHGTRQVVRTDQYGFPRGQAGRVKRAHGFTTGDLVRLVQPVGKYQGIHVGRLASIRASGTFDIKSGAMKISANHKNFTLIQRGDGYDYAA